MEAKVRFTGSVEDAARAAVEAVLEDDGGESVPVGQVTPAEAAEGEASLETGDVLEIWGLEWLREGTRGVLSGAGDGGLVETALEAGSEDTEEDRGFDHSAGGGESVDFDMTWGVCGEEYEGCVGSVFVSVGAGDVGVAERLLETGEGGICTVEGREGPSSTGRDPWAGVGVDGESFSIFPVREKAKVDTWRQPRDSRTKQQRHPCKCPALITTLSLLVGLSSFCINFNCREHTPPPLW